MRTASELGDLEEISVKGTVGEERRKKQSVYFLSPSMNLGLANVSCRGEISEYYNL